MQNEQICRCLGGATVNIGKSATVRVVEIRGDMVILRVQSHAGEIIDHIDAKEMENLEKALQTLAAQKRRG